MKLVRFVGMVTLACSLTVGVHAGGKADEDVNYLFVQTGQAAEIRQVDDRYYEIRIEEPMDQTIWFTDRPSTDTGRMSNLDFKKMWDKGVDPFDEDPPNAALELQDESGQLQTVTVTLMSMRLEGGQIIYRMRPLEVESFGLALGRREKLPTNLVPQGRFLNPAVFIDSHGCIR